MCYRNWGSHGAGEVRLAESLEAEVPSILVTYGRLACTAAFSNPVLSGAGHI